MKKIHRENTAQIYENNRGKNCLTGIIFEGTERTFIGRIGNTRGKLKLYILQRIDTLVKLLEDLENKPEGVDFVTFAEMKENNNENSIHSRLAHPPV